MQRSRIQKGLDGLKCLCIHFPDLLEWHILQLVPGVRYPRSVEHPVFAIDAHHRPQSRLAFQTYLLTRLGDSSAQAIGFNDDDGNGRIHNENRSLSLRHTERFQSPF